MILTSETVGDVLVVILRVKEFKAFNSLDFREAVEPLLEQTSKLVLDLHEVQFIDSSGIGGILMCIRRMDEKGGAAKLCCLTRSVEDLLELVRVPDITEVLPTREEAIAAFGDGGG